MLDDVTKRILALLSKKPNQRAASLARLLGIKRLEVNRLLHGPLRGRVEQDKANFCWSLTRHESAVGISSLKSGARSRPAAPAAAAANNVAEPASPRFRIRLKAEPSQDSGSDSPRASTNIGTEQELIAHFMAYAGLDELELARRVANGNVSSSKSRYSLLARSMIAALPPRLAEAVRGASNTRRAVRVESDGNVAESMSFRNIDFKELVAGRRWEDSAFYEDISKRFLFFLFRRIGNSEHHTFVGAVFWSMPPEHLESARQVWVTTRARVCDGKYDDLPRCSETRVAHVRTKGRNNSDTIVVPGGATITKRSFWLNRTYLTEVVKQLALSLPATRNGQR